MTPEEIAKNKEKIDAQNFQVSLHENKKKFDSQLASEVISSLKGHDFKINGMDKLAEKMGDDQKKMETLASGLGKLADLFSTLKGDKGEEGDKGEKGEDGYTPVKGKDYYTDAEINTIKKELTPIKGIDYVDGKDGKDGKNGRDGLNGRDGKDGKDGKDGQSIVGPKGDKGEKGDRGPAGAAVIPSFIPKGGETGKVLAKKSNYDYEFEWITPAAGGGEGTVTSVNGVAPDETGNVVVEETDPLFAASEAALLEPGDKDKLDSAVQEAPTDGPTYGRKNGEWTEIEATQGDDTAYGAGWDNSTLAPTQNAVYDKIQSLPGGHDAVTLDEDADTILKITDQEIGLDVQAANKVLASPVSGGSAVPTMRALVAADIPTELPSLEITESQISDLGTYIETETDPVFSASEAANFETGDKAALDAAETTANKSTSVVTDQASDTKYPSVKAVFDWVSSVIGATVILQGDWNATTNNPNLSGSITSGYAWRVSVAGTTDLGGITTWSVGDLAIKTATGWLRTAAADISAVWGNIGGTLSDQTDLQSALDAKADEATTISAGTGLSGGGSLAANRTLALANTAVTPGSYTNTNLTVDAQGRITAAANGSGGGGTSVNYTKNLVADTSEVVVAGKTTNTKIFEYVVPANTLGTDKILRITVAGTYKNASGSTSTLGLTAYYGGLAAGNIISSATSAAVATGAATGSFVAEFNLVAHGATNAQNGNMKAQVRGNATTPALFGAAGLPLAIDSTQNQPLYIYAKHSVANENTVVTGQLMTVELVNASDNLAGPAGADGIAPANFVVKADGTGDYTTIQAALDAAVAFGGCKIYLPDNEYTITTGLSIKSSFVTIEGNNHGTNIYCDGATVATLLSPNATTYEGFTLKNVNLTQTNATQQGTALSLGNMSRTKVENVNINSFGLALKVVDTADNTFYNRYSITVWDCNNGIDINSTNPVNDNLFFDCRVGTRANGYGMRMSNGQANHFLNCNFEPVSTTGTTGIILTTANVISNTFTNVWCEGNNLGASIAAEVIGTTFVGGNIVENTTDITDASTTTTYLNCNIGWSQLNQIPGLAQEAFDVDINGDLEPSDGNIFDDFYELDANDDLQPKA